MNMGVGNSLSSSFAAIHSDIEATHRRILFHYIDPNLIE